MMVSRFRRTVSFQTGPSSSNAATATAPKSYHVRSTSLPCRSHPLIPQLKDEINELKSSTSWQQVLLRQYKSCAPSSTSIPSSSISHLYDGLSRLKSIHESLDDILQLPQTQDSLQHSKTNLVEKLLEDFLKFVDAYGIFHTSMISLKQELFAAQVGLRRKDDSKLGIYIKAQKNVAKELSKLANAMRGIERPKVEGGKDVDELVYVVTDVHDLTVGVSGVVFEGVSDSLMGGSTSTLGRSGSWAGLGGFGRKRVKREVAVEDVFGGVVEGIQAVGVDDLWGLRKKGGEAMRFEVLKRMKGLEDCVCGLESWSEKVFRSLICTRVSLLNILTHQ